MAADSSSTFQGPAGDRRLDSWKEIAAYLRRHITTVRRWEKHEGLPVHRHVHHTLGSVYAFSSELDAWRHDRQPRLQRPNTDLPRAGHTIQRTLANSGRLSSIVRWGGAAGVVAVCAVAVLSSVHLVGLPAAHGVDPAAYQEYTIGRYHLWRDSEDNLRQAITHFERATKIDPAYAAAYASLAHAWWKRGLWSQTLPMTEAPARAAAERALQLDDSLPETYAVQADLERLYGGDLARAERLILKALELDPNHVDVHYSYGLVLMTLGRFPEAIAHMDTAARFDPLSPAIQSDYGRVLYRARRYDEAIVRLNRALELEPAMGWLVYSRLADVYERQGRYEQAVVALRRAGTEYGYRSAQAELARVFARMGNRAAAEQLLRDVERQSNEVSSSTIAAAYAALGDDDAAFRLLFEHADRKRPGPNFVPVDPLFESLHPDPRWKELIRRIGQPAATGAGRIS